MHPTPLTPTIDSVEGYLYRRRRSDLALTAGEAATLAVAVVRGCAAAPSRAAGAQWRLTADGRPVLVADPDGRDVLTVTVAVLDEVAALVSGDVRPGFARLRDAVLTEPPPAWIALEKRLLTVVAPQPLVLGPLAPVIPAVPRPSSVDSSDADPSALLDRVRAIARRVRPRVLFTGVAAAAVLTVATLSLLPPATPSDARGEERSPTSAPSADATGPGDASTTTSTARPSDQPTDSAVRQLTDGEPSSAATPTEPAPPVAGDVGSAASVLLRALAACSDDVCSARLRESPGGADEPAPLDPAVAQVEVIDDFGDVAVVRMSADDRSQYVTLVRQNDRWLVRSVRDVADQPS